MTPTPNPPPPASHRSQRMGWLRFAAWVGGIGALGLLSMPWWLGALLSVILSPLGGSFERYERLGYGRFWMSNLHFSNAQLEVKVSEVSAYQPMVWLFQLLQVESDNLFVELQDVTLTMAERSEVPEAPDPQAGMVALLRSIRHSWELGTTWIPSGSVQSLRLEQAQTAVELRKLHWQRSAASLHVERFGNASVPKLDLNLELLQPERLQLEIKDSETGDTAMGQFSTSELDSTLLLSIEGTLEDRKWSARAQWDATGWVPRSAQVRAPKLLLLPGNWIEAAPLERMEGSLVGDWDGQSYRLSTQLAVPEQDGGSVLLRGASLDLDLAGDLEQIEFHRADFKGSFGSLGLHEPVTFGITTMRLTGAATAEVDLLLDDLGLSWLSGRLTGIAELGSKPWESDASIRFELRSSTLQLASVEIESAHVSGWADRERVHVETWELTGSGQSVLAGQAQYHFLERHLESASLKGSLDSTLLTADLPLALGFDRLILDATAAGPVQGLRYAGTVGIRGLKLDGIQPLEVFADLQGDETGVKAQLLRIESPFGARVESSGSWYWSDPPRVQLDTLSLFHGETEAAPWHLEAPTELRLGQAPLWGVGPPVAVDLLRWVSGDQVRLELELLGDAAAKVPSLQLHLSQMNLSDLLQPWVEALLPDIRVQSFHLDARELADQATLSGDLNIVWVDGDQDPIAVIGRFEWGEKGLRFEEMVLRSGDAPWLTIEGHLPYRIDFASGNPQLGLIPGGDLKLDLNSSHSEQWLPWLSPYVELPLELANLSMQLRGSPEQPTGALTLDLTTLAGVGDHRLPPTHVRGSLAFEGMQVELNAVQLELGNAVFELGGRLHLPEELLAWVQLSRIAIPWDQMGYELRSAHSDLAPLASFWPEILRPSGQLQFELSGSLASGAEGILRVQGLSTRAIFPFGSLRDMDVELHLSGKRAELQRFEGFIAREAIEATGWIDFADSSLPRFELELLGNDIPLVRQAGVLLRTDMQLRLHQDEAAARLSGHLKLKDGVYLSDITGLFDQSAGGRSVSSRPPYFSVEADPFSDWQLDLAVTGDAFMRLDTPVVEGVVSMDMKLGGTLGEPFMVGRAWFEEGRVKFPFAVFEMEQSVIQLNREDPYIPRLEMRAESSRLDYRLQMHLSGTASEPELFFSSSPSLSQDQILMMVVAGQDPGGRLDYSGAQRASKIGSYLSAGLLGSGSSDSSNLLSRLEMQWGNKLSKRGRETIEIEFELDDRFQLLAEYDEYDNWNGGIRWRLLDPSRMRQDRPQEEGGPSDDR